MTTIATSLLVLGFLAAGQCSESAPQPITPHHFSAKHALAQAAQAKGNKPDKAGKKKPKFTISKETTYVTGPIDKDGYIDYAAALNERLRQGVTPANNANVLLWKALGPRPEGTTMPAEFFQWMGIEAPPEDGEYFIDLSRHLKDRLNVEPGQEADEILAQLDRCVLWPWTAKEYPKIAAWLKANDKPLALVVEATKRSQYFSPLVPTKTKKGSSGLIGALMPGVARCRGFANALAARAMLRVGQGADEDAWQDLLACHRLGRLVARGSTLIEALVGIALEYIAGRADLGFLDRTKLKAKAIENCLRDLQKLPPLPVVADKVDLGERFFFLDTVMMIDRHGIGYLEGLSATGQSKDRSPFADFIGNLSLAFIDWDPALRNANRWYDRLATAMREKDRSLREKKLDQIEAELKALKKNLVDSGDLSKIVIGGKQAKGKVVGDTLISLLVPAVRRVQTAGDRSRQVHDNLAVAFALAWYQRDHGRYPNELDALAPKYLEQIPQDIFSGKALIYRPSKDGYLLYSVGVNGKDDDGRSYDDDPPGDDLRVRMPLPELRRK